MAEDVFELSLEPQWRDDARRAYSTILEMGDRIMTITEREVGELLSGAIDMHVHAFPDPEIDTGWDQINIAKRATEAGMGGIVYKAHTFPTAATVPLVQQVIDDYARSIGKPPARVYGGIVLNNYVGGLNPASVEMAIKLGGKVVWLPSHHSAHHRKVMGQEGGIRLLDDNGEPVKPLREIFSLVAEHDLILDPCHAGTRERFVVIQEAKKAGVKRIIITHPDWNVTKATIEQQAEMGRMGAYIGLFMYGAVPNFNNPQCDPMEMIRIIKQVTPQRTVVATDLGTAVNVHPVEGMRLFIRILLACNISKPDIVQMIKGNPRWLLGLDRDRD
jgi:hypothetical protein